MTLEVATKSELIEVIRTTVTYEGITQVQYWSPEGDFLAVYVPPKIGVEPDEQK